jgi:hypothetical protein
MFCTCQENKHTPPPHPIIIARGKITVRSLKFDLNNLFLWHFYVPLYRENHLHVWYVTNSTWPSHWHSYPGNVLDFVLCAAIISIAITFLKSLILIEHRHCISMVPAIILTCRAVHSHGPFWKTGCLLKKGVLDNYIIMVFMYGGNTREMLKRTTELWPTVLIFSRNFARVLKCPSIV